MYTNHKSALYVVAMLKAQGINRIVISPGTSHNAMVRSIDEDNYFQTYSVTDERSAAFFAIGIAQETQSPVAIMSTSGTATCNYVSAVTEAYHRNIPLVIITADKHPYYLNQKEDQMINQPPMFQGITKYAVTLPEEIRSERDDWYCRRLLNEAFLKLNHHGTGPIHINVPISYGMFALGDTFTTQKLPEINIIKRLDHSTTTEAWKKLFDSVRHKRILIFCGQDTTFSPEKEELLETIARGFNCVIAKDNLSNLHCEHAIEIEKAQPFTPETKPEIIISLDGSHVTFFKYTIKSWDSSVEHWMVDETGELADPYHKLTHIIEDSSIGFLKIMAQHAGKAASTEYYDACRDKLSQFTIPELPYSNSYVCRQVLAALPPNSMLHLGNSSTIRIAQFFNMHPSIRVYCNRGVHGIDGCMSAFIGQAAISERLSFLLLGDLTFFYDMNALWNQYVRKNARILLFNNGGASLFYFNTRGLKNFPSLDKNAGAAHISSAKGWVESRGFTYLSARTQEEFDKQLPLFTSEDSEAPILMEVFTDRDTDGKVWHSIIEEQASRNSAAHHSGGIKEKLKKMLKKSI